MLKLGNLSLTLLSDGNIKLDGGIVFGDLPKTSWEQKVRVDRRNRLSVGMNCLLIQTPKQTILVDTGAGSKNNHLMREQYGLGPSRLQKHLRELGVMPRDIDLVVLTHLHFDHSGGGTKLDRSGEVVPTFPNATYLMQRTCWEEATSPSERSKPTYDPLDFLPLEDRGQVAWLDGDSEIVPGVWARVTNAHARGHQMVLVDEGSERVAFLGDLIPTHHHVDLACIAASDRFPDETLEQKRSFLDRAEREGWLVVFGHGYDNHRATYVERRNGKLNLRPIGF